MAGKISRKPVANGGVTLPAVMCVWRRITYSKACSTVRRIGSRLPATGMGARRPLLILSGNPLEPALLGAACFCIGIPYAPISPAYSLVSGDHAKLRDIAVLILPGVVFADGQELFALAIATAAGSGTETITLGDGGT